MTPESEKAFNAIILSVAAEETALSLLITAESKKIEYVLACAKEKRCSEQALCMVLEVNNSVNSIMARIVDIQMILKNKLSLVTGFYPHHRPCPCPPTPPPHPPAPPCSPCHTESNADNNCYGMP
jgi:hypothetical protein